MTTSEDGRETLSVTTPTLSTATLINVICDKTFSIEKGDMEWGEAKVAAEAKGGTLARILTGEDWSQVLFQLGSSVTTDPLWIGLQQKMNSADEKSGWKWLSGEKLDETGYTNWSANQPDNGGAAEAVVGESADGLAWNQSASYCDTFGHVGDELLSNGDGAVSGYVVEYQDSTGATKYQAVRGRTLTWDAARQAAYSAYTNTNGVETSVLPARTTKTLGASTTTNGSTTVTVTTTTGVSVGMIVTGVGIANGTTITGIAGNTVTLSQAATATNAGVTLEADVNPRARLATLQSTAEYAAAKAQLEAQGVGTNEVLWLGGYQSGGSLNETSTQAGWHWVSDVAAGDGLVHPESDGAIDFGALTLHGGELDNLSSGVYNENVAYMSGGSGQWSDSTGKQTDNGVTVKGYLLQYDTISAVTVAQVDAAVQWVGQYRAIVGSELSAIQTKLDRIGLYSTNLQEAESKIGDTDLALEAAQLGKNRALLQMAQMAFTQANRNQELMLRLLA